MKVSTLLITYNHERFVGQAIESVLMQKASFPWELVIAEDCSTDGTRDVIRRYRQKHPDRIRVLLNRKNIRARRTMVRACTVSRGQYMAILEGDDYWTSPHKLQRQADLLDEHGDYALSFHSVQMVWDDDSRKPALFRPEPLKDVYMLKDLLKSNFIASCSPMYRRSMFPGYPPWFFLMPVGDWPHHVLHAQHGRIGSIDEPMGVYRQHSGGVYSMRKETEKLRVAIEVLRRFQCVLGGEHRRVLNRSLCEHYCRLARQYCEDGDLLQARASVRECLH
jgi:glycosyltransferase involved in cell wall biosynthesis